MIISFGDHFSSFLSSVLFSLRWSQGDGGYTESRGWRVYRVGISVTLQVEGGACCLTQIPDNYRWTVWSASLKCGWPSHIPELTFYLYWWHLPPFTWDLLFLTSMALLFRLSFPLAPAWVSVTCSLRPSWFYPTFWNSHLVLVPAGLNDRFAGCQHRS